VALTQAERRATTQAKILDATIESLVEDGYAGTSTPAICRRAEVSQGALYRYWPTKGELLAAAAEHLLTRVTAGYEAGFAGRRIGAREALEALWAAYRQPDLMAAVELYVAARTDPDLAAALRVIEPAHRANLQRIALSLLDPRLTAHPDAPAIVELALAAVQGASIGAAVVDTSHDVVLDELERALNALLTT
jgi:AcrR family transcriptional regulator